MVIEQAAPAGGANRAGAGLTRALAAWLLLAGTLGQSHAVAQEAGPELADDSEWTFTAYFENDLFFDTDARYTNGLKLSWTSPDLTRYRDNGKLPAAVYPLIETLPFIDRPGLQRNVVISLGQQIYTPVDIARRDLIDDDRPYAGWLYLGLGFYNKNPKRLDTIEIQLGVVGELALAEEAQDLVHALRDIDRAQGWDNQLETEPGINLVYETKWRLLEMYGNEGRRGLGFDFIPRAGISLGNVYTYANVGGEARFGWNLPADFGNSIIRPGGDASAPIDGRDPRRDRRLGIHVFGSLDGRAVLRDIFLDGNTFTSSHSVDKKHTVLDAAFGVSVLAGPVKVTAARVLRTREFRGQPEAHRFGSLSFSYTF